MKIWIVSGAIVGNKKLLARINTYNSYRELSLAKTKLEEAEMWLSKLLKEGGKNGN